MPEPLPITIDKGLGINTADGLFSLPLGMTDDCLNVDGDGTIVCAKRYGAQRETATAMGGGLHDLAFVSPTVGPSAFHLWCLYTSGGSAIVNAARYTPGGTAFADVAVNDALGLGEQGEQRPFDLCQEGARLLAAFAVTQGLGPAGPMCSYSPPARGFALWVRRRV